MSGAIRAAAALACVLMFTAGAPAGASTPVLLPAGTSIVSVSPRGAQADGVTAYSSISSHGRYVAYWSEARNLVRGDSNGVSDIFVIDRATGRTSRVSVSTRGAQGNDASYNPQISANGRYVAYWSTASNLVPGDTNDAGDVFVFDRALRVTTRVSTSRHRGQGDDESRVPAISADGRFVAFLSAASNLVPGDTNQTWDVFVHDRRGGTVTRVSRSTRGAQTNATSYESSGPSISGDGRYVAYYSLASNLVARDTNSSWDSFVTDRVTGTTTRISRATNGAQGNDSSYAPAISANGRAVVYWSLASNLVPGDTNETGDTFVTDRVTGRTTRVSVRSGGAQSDGLSYSGSLSGDGRYVTYQSFATNLVPGDTNGESDVFVFDRLRRTAHRASVATDGTQGDGSSYAPSLSRDGRHVTFSSSAATLVRRDTNGLSDVFVASVR